jgi:hypothetical protein
VASTHLTPEPSSSSTSEDSKSIICDNLDHLALLSSRLANARRRHLAPLGLH